MSTVSPVAGSLHDHGHHAHTHDRLALLKQVPTFSTDHKVIGLQFLITTLLMLLVGGALALGGSLAAGLPLGVDAHLWPAIRGGGGTNLA